MSILGKIQIIFKIRTLESIDDCVAAWNYYQQKNELFITLNRFNLWRLRAI